LVVLLYYMNRGRKIQYFVFSVTRRQAADKVLRCNDFVVVYQAIARYSF
jgi:plasmid replication initiation protein